MKKSLRVMILVGLLSAFSVTAAFAAPDTTDGFICPVLGGEAGENGQAEVFANPGGNFFTILGPEVTVPLHATNDNGAGSPGGSHASPGDSSYTAIWSGD
jgi:hypothetical protein